MKKKKQDIKEELAEMLKNAEPDDLEDMEYICPNCGHEMEFMENTDDVLICPKCGWDMCIDEYANTENPYLFDYAVDLRDEQEYEEDEKESDEDEELYSDDDEMELYDKCRGDD